MFRVAHQITAHQVRVQNQDLQGRAHCVRKRLTQILEFPIHHQCQFQPIVVDEDHGRRGTRTTAQGRLLVQFLDFLGTTVTQFKIPFDVQQVIQLRAQFSRPV